MSTSNIRDYVIRGYEAARDAKALRECFVELQDHEHALLPDAPTGEAIADEYLAWMFERAARFKGCVFVAERDGELLGYATVLARMPRTDPDDPVPEHAFLSEIVVREAARDAGVGQALMAAAEDYAKSRGAPEMRLTVWPENTGARRFYQRLGYADGMIQMHKSLS